MDRPDHLPSGEKCVPLRAELESRLQAKIITFEDGGVLKPGGMCGCCGSGPNVEPDYRSDPWYVYQAGICDSDGIYFAMLCEGCLEEIRSANAARPQTLRDEQAKIITQLLGDDFDGAQAMMEDFEIIETEDPVLEEVGVEPNESDEDAQPRFELGHVVMTQGVEAATTHADRMRALARHVTSDWGDVCAEDKGQNDWALANGARILSVYQSSSGETFWIITEADRSVTTLLLPEEY